MARRLSALSAPRSSEPARRTEPPACTVHHPLAARFRTWTTPSRLWRAFVELKIGDDVCRWVEKQREAEPHLGRRPLARRLQELTGRRIDPVTLTRWCPGSFHEER